MSKSIHEQVMSPSCLQDLRDCGCDPTQSLQAQPDPSNEGEPHFPCQAEPRAQPQPGAEGAQSLKWKIKVLPQEQGR